MVVLKATYWCGEVGINVALLLFMTSFFQKLMFVKLLKYGG